MLQLPPACIIPLLQEPLQAPSLTPGGGVQDTGYSIASIYLTFSILLCGYYVRINTLTLSIMRGLTWASFSKYTFDALAYNEFFDRTWTPEGLAGCNLKHTRALRSLNPWKLCELLIL